MTIEKTPLQLLRESLSQKPKSEITNLLLTKEPYEIKKIGEIEGVVEVLKKLEQELDGIPLSIPTVNVETFVVDNWGISGLGGYIGNPQPVDSKHCLRAFIQHYRDYLDGRIGDEAQIVSGKFLVQGLYPHRWLQHTAT